MSRHKYRIEIVARALIDRRILRDDDFRALSPIGVLILNRVFALPRTLCSLDSLAPLMRLRNIRVDANVHLALLDGVHRALWARTAKGYQP